MKWIILGLGNPGAEYAKTRHNAGRIIVEQLRIMHNFPDWEYKRTHDALVSKGSILGKEVLLVLPETYMNESGKSLLKLVKSEAEAAQLIVIHDDADLPFGSWRMAFARGAGGQRGIASIIATLKTKEFVRSRIGIAPVLAEGEARMKAESFVLEKFRANELATLERSVEQVSGAIEQLITEGLSLARSKWKKWGSDEK